MINSQGKIPTIDLKGLDTNAEVELFRIAAEVREACRTLGFFYVVNHGVPQALIHGAFEANRRFHDLPIAQKLELKMNSSHRGYQSLGGSTLKASARFDAATRANQLESFFIRNEPAELAEANKSVGTMFGENQWPADLQFKATLLSYERNMRVLGMRLLPAFSVALDQPPDFFTAFAQPAAICLRLLHYPPVLDQVSQEQFRIHPHTDYGFLTFLTQDGAGGLQIQTLDGGWLDAEPIPGTFVVNVGDLLARWTNEFFQSTPHRVVCTDARRDRYSIAYFFGPSDDTIIECLPKFVGEGEPKHPPIQQGEYIASRMNSNYQDRKGAQ